MALDCLRVDCSLPVCRASFPLLRLDLALFILGFSRDFLGELLLGLISSPEGIKPRLDDNASSIDDLAESLAELSRLRGDLISKSFIPEFIDGFRPLVFDFSEC